MSSEAEQSWGIVGYRHFVDRKRLDSELATLLETRGRPTRVISGGATGADTLAKEWANEKGIALVEHRPISNTRDELLARNTLIVRDSTLIIAFVSVKSRGTYDTINKAKKAGKEVIVIRID